MHELTEQFRIEAEKYFGARRRTRYPKYLRQMAMDFVAEAADKGLSMGTISAQLGLDRGTIIDWCKKQTALGSEPQEPSLVPVRVVPQPKEALTKSWFASAACGQAVVYGPGGVRVEGLDVAGIAELLQRLR